MRLSQFNQYAFGYPTCDDVLVHNTFAGSYVVLGRDDVRLLRECDAGTGLTASTSEVIDAYELADPNVGIVVDSHEGEDLEFRRWFEMQRSQKQVMEVTVGLNLACNFDCPYCCQAEVMDGSVMKESVAKQSAQWIAGRAKREGVESVQLVFVGGEPLLHPSRLEVVAREARTALAGTSIAFGFTLLTNAVFLNEAMLNRLVPLGLSKAQITIDGDATTHKLSRVSKKGDDTFAMVFHNAIKASRQIDVCVNGNYKESTIGGFLPLLDLLEEAGLPQGSSVKFGPALGGLRAPENSLELAPTWSRSIAEHQIALYDEILRHGFEMSQPNAAGPCEFHERHAFAIGTDGTIFKCPGFLGEPSWGIGHVESGLTDRYEAMLASTPQSGCDGCAHRPNCGGGCIAEAMLQSGELAGVSCEKTYFERNSHDALYRGYELATSDSAREAALGFPSPKRPLPDSAVSNVSRGQRSTLLRILGPQLGKDNED